ncbi:uncharacterized protein METZ01_LOCUS366178, partial [marine metagenome]
VERGPGTLGQRARNQPPLGQVQGRGDGQGRSNPGL